VWLSCLRGDADLKVSDARTTGLATCRFGHTAIIGSVDGFQFTRDDVYCVLLTLLCVLAGPPTPATSQVPQPMDNLSVIYEYITRAKIDTPPIW
jgi:hypothetical protein